MVDVVSELELNMVPIIETDFILDYTLEELIDMADGMSRINPNTLREGIVIRPEIEIIDTSFNKLHRSRMSFKVISNQFLLKYDK